MNYMVHNAIDKFDIQITNHNDCKVRKKYEQNRKQSQLSMWVLRQR